MFSRGRVCIMVGSVSIRGAFGRIRRGEIGDVACCVTVESVPLSLACPDDVTVASPKAELTDGRVEERRGPCALPDFLERSRWFLGTAEESRVPGLLRKKQLRTRSSGNSCASNDSEMVDPEALVLSFLVLYLLVEIPKTLVSTCEKALSVTIIH